MLHGDEIVRMVREIAGANLTAKIVQNVLVEPAIDSQGQEALRITVVIPPGAAEKIDGDAVLDTLVQVQRRLRQVGEERFPIVEYATQEELEDVGDSES